MEPITAIVFLAVLVFMVAYMCWDKTGGQNNVKIKK